MILDLLLIYGEKMTGLPQNKIYPITMTYTEHWVYGKKQWSGEIISLFMSRILKMLHLMLISWWAVFLLPDKPHYPVACIVFALFNNFYQSF